MSHDYKKVIGLFLLDKFYRDECGSYYVLPLVKHCARYAIQELAEMDDVMMRMETSHQRNNDRTPTTDKLRKELGQALCMVLDCIVLGAIKHDDDFGGHVGGTEQDVGLAIMWGVGVASMLADRETQCTDDSYARLYASATVDASELVAQTSCSSIGGLTIVKAATISVCSILDIVNLFGFNAEDMIHERYAQVKEKWGAGQTKQGGQEPVFSSEGSS